MNPVNFPALTPVICGPTAGGKSDLAVALALRAREEWGIDAEIVTADAFQVYRGMDIGTAKPTMEERREVVHHLIDVVDLRATALQGSANTDTHLKVGGTATFTVDDWLRMARERIADVRGRGALPIVVGGTHLYIKALLDGLFDGPEPDAALRAKLTGLDPEARRAELQRVDPAAAARIHPNDIRRTVRALEVYRLTGTPISAMQKQWDRASMSSPDGLAAHQLIILDWESEALNRRINARVKQMMERGLLEEVRTLAAAGQLVPGSQAAEALGYKQLLAHLADPVRFPVAEAVERIKVDTRRFGKNQRTWLRRLRTFDNTLTVAMPGTGTPEAVGVVLTRLRVGRKI